MRVAALAQLVRRDLRRSARTFVVAALGIAVGIGTLAFFVSLGAGMREVVLGRIFPNDRIEVAPPESSAGALITFAMGVRATGIDEPTLRHLRTLPGVRAVYPKMRLVFPTSGRGGHEIVGRDIGTGELIVDGIEPSLVRADLPRGTSFSDPAPTDSHRECRAHTDCPTGELCNLPLTNDGGPFFPGACGHPIPALISPYLVEVFNGAIAPAHHLPPIGQLLLRSAQGLTIEWDLGRAGLGQARQGRQRREHARIIGISPHAIDLGFTVPLDVARRLNREFAGEAASELFTSATVQLARPDDVGPVTAEVRQIGLEVKTSGAEQMGLLVAVITAILSLTSVIVVIVASVNIAHVFFTIIAERRGEIGLMRALGATRIDVRSIVIAEAAVLGLVASIVGIALARLAAWGADRLAASKLPPFPFKPEHWFVFEPRVMLAIVVFGVLASVLSALAPASRAANVEPATALASGV